MKFFGINIIFSIVLFFGVVLSYNLYSQTKTSNEFIELVSEEISNSNFLLLDLDVHEETQIIFSANFLATIENNIQHNHFYISSPFSRAFFTVWLPPKLI